MNKTLEELISDSDSCTKRLSSLKEKEVVCHKEQKEIQDRIFEMLIKKARKDGFEDGVRVSFKGRESDDSVDIEDTTIFGLTFDRDTNQIRVSLHNWHNYIWGSLKDSNPRLITAEYPLLSELTFL